MHEISAGLVEYQGPGNLDVGSAGKCDLVPKKHGETSTPYSNKRDFEEALSDPSKQWYAALKIVSVW